MAVTTCAELVNMTRTFMRAWPVQDPLSASVSSTASLLSVSDGTLFYKNWEIEVDQEVMVATANGSATTVAVSRGQRGSTAASHASTAVALIKPHFFTIEIVTALNNALQEMYPRVYKPVLDTSLTAAVNTYEYTVPNLDGNPIPYLSKIELKPTGDLDFQEVRGWNIRRGATPKIQFQTDLQVGTLRVHGYGPFTDLVYSGSMDAQFPLNLVKALPVGAAAFLLASGEAGRSRADSMPNDERESANRVGGSMSASNSLYQRFLRMVSNGAPPALPPHAKPTF